MEAVWYEILQQNVRGDEAHYIGPDYVRFDLPDEPDSELRAMQINVREWKDICRQQFLAAIRPFTDLRYASRQVYGKHLPPPGPPRHREWIESESKKRGHSLFYLEIPEDEMLTVFFHAIFDRFSGGEDMEGLSSDDKPLWDKLLSDDNSRIAFRCTGPIGASDAVPTEYICFELDAATPVVHAYPVAEAEAHRINNSCRVTMINELQEWQRR